ncbi:uncharacterized protein LOC113518721 [Galleria mellonella]|uniref:Uncharacterized protein LOC113518721 n=1 Tax=Galleria mellonella TaxID=7137 RepID=A0ABM3MTC8_GALME|nr:uncharacterized protein LOC113518721 [Galleria mellonella]XP_052754621.1 uncharacterized protein LOC113518721 [Galleria mellonella]XP_052754622.1 uncharacterized protein LOC113518721 [Galleria mellonella]XP_052754623.1 uncharacterized protein LOC113518721 [Galleria mellonella]
MDETIVEEDGNSQQYSFIYVDPNIQSCNEHGDMYLHKDESLIKPGDMFDTQESFNIYVNGYAEQWLFYYTLTNSYTQDPSKENYTYRCIYYQPKGVRKRSEPEKSRCPCKIVLKRLPYNPDVLTVEFVCHHHNHELSKENFLKLKDSKRIQPQIREEIMDLLYLEVEPKILKKYIKELTGLNLNLNYFMHIAKKMKKDNVERTFTPEQLDELTKKVKDLRFIYGNVKDTDCESPKTNIQRGRRKRKADGDVNNTNAEDITEDLDTLYSSDKKLKQESEETEYEDIDTKSRLETCLQRLSYDEETLESVKRLQSSVQCETQRNPWISEEICPTPSNGTSYMSDSMGTTQNEVQLEIGNNTSDFQTETIDDSYIQNISEQNVEVSEISNSDGQIVTQNYVLGNNEENTPESYVLANNSETYVLENSEQNVNYVLTSNEHNIPHSYVLENGIVVTYNGDGQGFTESEVVYDNDHTAVGNEQEGNTNYVLVEENTAAAETTVEESSENIESQDNEKSKANNVSDTPSHSDYEYIHRFNIDQYMTQQWFIRCIQTVAEDTKMKAVDMLSDLYLGKTMFKLITTRKVDMQTIRITYLVDNVPSLSGFDCNDRVKYKLEAAKYCKKLMSLKKKLSHSSRYIHSLKGTIESLKKANMALASRNKHLERVKSQNVLHNYKKDMQHLRETKDSLLSQISDTERQIVHLKEVKRNLKTDICTFISKKVLLQQMSGESNEKLENVKNTLAKAIETCKNTVNSVNTSNNQVNEEQYVISNLDDTENFVMAVENVPEGISIDGQYNDGDIVYVVDSNQQEVNLQNIS